MNLKNIFMINRIIKIENTLTALRQGRETEHQGFFERKLKAYQEHFKACY